MVAFYLAALLTNSLFMIQLVPIQRSVFWIYHWHRPGGCWIDWNLKWEVSNPGFTCPRKWMKEACAGNPDGSKSKVLNVCKAIVSHPQSYPKNGWYWFPSVNQSADRCWVAVPTQIASHNQDHRGEDSPRCPSQWFPYPLTQMKLPFDVIKGVAIVSRFACYS